MSISWVTECDKSIGGSGVLGETSVPHPQPATFNKSILSKHSKQLCACSLKNIPIKRSYLAIPNYNHTIHVLPPNFLLTVC